MAVGLFDMSYAYGFLPDIDNRRHLLTFVVIEKLRINFCIQIDDNASKRFFYDSMEYEIRETVDVWLRAVPELEALKATIARVECDNPEVNLVVDIASPQSRNSHMAWATYDTSKTYIRIVINTNFRYELRSERYETVDFAYFDRFRNSESREYSYFIQRANQDHLPPWELAGLMRRAGIRGIDWPEQIRFSSYPLLLHEMGHAFGLCDTTDEEIADCDSSTLRVGLSQSQPGSVMKSNGFFYLAADDISGITELVRGHEGGPYCLNDLRSRVREINGVVPSKAARKRSASELSVH